MNTEQTNKNIFTYKMIYVSVFQFNVSKYDKNFGVSKADTYAISDGLNR